jgi:hypothetical protein
MNLRVAWKGGRNFLTSWAYYKLLKKDFVETVMGYYTECDFERWTKSVDGRGRGLFLITIP